MVSLRKQRACSNTRDYDNKDPYFLPQGNGFFAKNRFTSEKNLRSSFSVDCHSPGDTGAQSRRRAWSQFSLWAMGYADSLSPMPLVPIWATAANCKGISWVECLKGNKGDTAFKGQLHVHGPPCGGTLKVTQTLFCLQLRQPKQHASQSKSGYKDHTWQKTLISSKITVGF